MHCEEFERRLEDPGARESLEEHATSCPACGRRLGLVRALRSLPPVAVPPGLDERVLAAARRTPSRILRPILLRTAAAALALVLGGAALWLALPANEDYRPRNLHVVEVGRSGFVDEETILEEVYGPATPILTREGGAGDASRR